LKPSGVNLGGFFVFSPLKKGGDNKSDNAFDPEVCGGGEKLTATAWWWPLAKAEMKA